MADNYYKIFETTFIWDEDKNQQNIRKHKIDFRTAALVFNDDFRLEFPDEAHNSDEQRYNAIGLVHDILFVVFCERERSGTENVDIRIISARYATKTEINAYNNAFRKL